MKLQFATSPCPNDTFSYYKLIKDSVYDFLMQDIETLNENAEKETFPITKLSFAAYLSMSDKYELLNAGAALGIGTGPVFVAKRGWNGEGVVAIPGVNTTAALLYKFYAGANAKVSPMLFSDILPALAKNEISAAVLIHEGRFVFQNYGAELIADLGDFWTGKTNLPVPLGCVCLRKDLLHIQNEVEENIRASIRYAFDNIDEILPFVKQHARHLEDEVVRKHIFAFVNEYSYDISKIKNSLLKHLKPQ